MTTPTYLAKLNDVASALLDYGWNFVLRGAV